MNIIQDGQGNQSSMRVVLLAWCLGLLLGITYLTVLHGVFPVIPAEYVALIGMVLTGKVWQTSIEIKQDGV